MAKAGRMFIARHGETIFNAVGRMQGDGQIHTPLTRRGFGQADKMGAALAQWLGTHQALELWCSPAGRAQQTLSVMAEHIGADWHQRHVDARLNEINVGSWTGQNYAEIRQEIGDFVCTRTGLFTKTAPDGEDYPAVATRLRAWLAGLEAIDADRLVVMHGMSSRVLRGIMLGLEPDRRFGVPVAEGLPQGTLVMIGGGQEQIIRLDATGIVE
ncbi:MAG: histidine phosphatase family protein [Sphingomonadaceae bacterium]|nr:histidine phosphatase family protein [Sphingomonadaceae bacterium]